MIAVKDNSKKEIDRSHMAIDKTLDHYKSLIDYVNSDTNLVINKFYETVRLRNLQIQMLRRMV